MSRGRLHSSPSVRCYLILERVAAGLFDGAMSVVAVCAAATPIAQKAAGNYAQIPLSLEADRGQKQLTHPLYAFGDWVLPHGEAL